MLFVSVLLDALSMIYVMTIITVCMTNGSHVLLAHIAAWSPVPTFPVAAPLFVLNGDIRAGSVLVLLTDGIANLFVLGLLDRRLVVLRAGAHELLLNIVDTYTTNMLATRYPRPHVVIGDEGNIPLSR